MSKKIKKFRSRGEKIFRFLIFILILALLGLGYLKVDTYLLEKEIAEKNVELDQKELELLSFQNASSYDKFLLIKEFEKKTVDMPWFEHIPKIIEIFEDLKNVDSSSSDTIILSDFKVSLEEITLKGTVSSLKALYYNSPNGKFKALLDRFNDLVFVRDVSIKTYDRVGTNYFEFVLTAKVVNDGGK